MTTPDFKSAAIEYSRTHCVPPASEVRRCMEIGAEMMAKAVTQKLKRIHDMKQPLTLPINGAASARDWLRGLVLRWDDEAKRLEQWAAQWASADNKTGMPCKAASDVCMEKASVYRRCMADLLQAQNAELSRAGENKKG